MTIFTGWWFHPIPKILVNWDDELPNIWENKSHVPVTTNQLMNGKWMYLDTQYAVKNAGILRQDVDTLTTLFQ